MKTILTLVVSFMVAISFASEKDIGRRSQFKPQENEWNDKMVIGLMAGGGVVLLITLLAFRGSKKTVLKARGRAPVHSPPKSQFVPVLCAILVGGGMMLGAWKYWDSREKKIASQIQSYLQNVSELLERNQRIEDIKGETAVLTEGLKSGGYAEREERDRQYLISNLRRLDYEKIFINARYKAKTMPPEQLYYDLDIVEDEIKKTEDKLAKTKLAPVN